MKRIKKGIYIVKGREILTENQTEGDGVLLISDHARIIISKKDLGRMPWHEAMQRCVAAGKQLPDRHQAIDMAKYHSHITDALKIIGGDPIECTWYWLCEEYNSSSSYAWFYIGTYGTLRTNLKYYSITVRPVTAF